MCVYNQTGPTPTGRGTLAVSDSRQPDRQTASRSSTISSIFRILSHVLHHQVDRPGIIYCCFFYCLMVLFLRPCVVAVGGRRIVRSRDYCNILHHHYTRLADSHKKKTSSSSNNLVTILKFSGVGIELQSCVYLLHIITYNIYEKNILINLYVYHVCDIY